MLSNLAFVERLRPVAAVAPPIAALLTPDLDERQRLAFFACPNMGLRPDWTSARSVIARVAERIDTHLLR